MGQYEDIKQKINQGDGSPNRKGDQPAKIDDFRH
jgi:hypothetical protein